MDAGSFSLPRRIWRPSFYLHYPLACLGNLAAFAVGPVSDPCAVIPPYSENTLALPKAFHSHTGSGIL